MCLTNHSQNNLTFLFYLILKDIYEGDIMFKYFMYCIGKFR